VAVEPVNIRKWRERAEEYRALADSAVGLHTRRSMLSLAETYDDMALNEEQKIGKPTAEYYKLRADECRRLATIAKADARALFQVLERRWQSLARGATPEKGA
jgi:hypothetical protein